MAAAIRKLFFRKTQNIFIYGRAASSLVKVFICSSLVYETCAPSAEDEAKSLFMFRRPTCCLQLHPMHRLMLMFSPSTIDFHHHLPSSRLPQVDGLGLCRGRRDAARDFCVVDLARAVWVNRGRRPRPVVNELMRQFLHRLPVQAVSCRRFRHHLLDSRRPEVAQALLARDFPRGQGPEPDVGRDRGMRPHHALSPPKGVDREPRIIVPAGEHNVLR
mmetsp:Transcript_19350/g.48396  ORF Transcript_19350/g.48396 Transcript_19350/m.48396 type:complete len:217 (+) Transcript_19350:598-1248(+)